MRTQTSADHKKIPLHIWGDNWSESYLRKSFNLKHKLETAIMRIFADTGYELYINGRFIAAVNEWVNNRDYDVRPYLVTGKNVIAIRALNYGGHRGLVVELRIVDNTGTVATVISDHSWKTAPVELWGWRSLDYNDKNWTKARILDTAQSGREQWYDHPGSRPDRIIPCLTGTPFFQGEIPKYTDSPFFNSKTPASKTSTVVQKLMGKEYTESRKQYPREIIHPVRLCEYNKGNGLINGIRSLSGKTQIKVDVVAPRSYDGPVLFLDFGEEMAGYLRVAINSKEGVNLRLLYGETLSECHNIAPRTALLRKMVTEEILIAPGDQQWESRTRQGFRFLRIEFTDCPNGAILTDINVHSANYPVNYTGYFSCSDPLLNKIWSSGRRTLHLCMQEYYLDAIKRDRFLWVGDLRLEALINYYLFGDLELLRSSCAAFAKVQYPDGAIPSVLGEGAPVLWDYVAWWPVCFADYYQFSADKTFLQAHLKEIIKAAKWLVAKAGRDGLINVPANTTEKWLCILSRAVGKDPAFNALYYKAISATIAVLDAAGDKKTKAYFENIAAGIAKSFFKKFNVLPEDYLPDPAEPATGALNSFDKCEAYFKSNQISAGLNYIRENWRGMLDYGCDTFWEIVFVDPAGSIQDKQKWDKYQTISHCHGWTGSPSYLLPAYVAGIRPTSPGFKTFTFEPHPGDLKNVNCVVPTPNGEIATRIQRNGNKLEIQLYIPAGCKAEVVLPYNENLTVNSDKKMISGKAIPKLTMLNDKCSFKLQKSGLYTFLL